MLRRTILLALAGLAIAAPSASAKSHTHWYSQMQNATQTASRSMGGCTIANGSYQGSLAVSCGHGDEATLTYSFPLGGKHIKGQPWCGVTRWWGFADVHRSWRISGGALRVTVTVADGDVMLSTVNVGYYA